MQTYNDLFVFFKRGFCKVLFAILVFGLLPQAASAVCVYDYMTYTMVCDGELEAVTENQKLVEDGFDLSAVNATVTTTGISGALFNSYYGSREMYPTGIRKLSIFIDNREFDFSNPDYSLVFGLSLGDFDNLFVQSDLSIDINSSKNSTVYGNSPTIHGIYTTFDSLLYVYGGAHIRINDANKSYGIFSYGGDLSFNYLNITMSGYENTAVEITAGGSVDLYAANMSISVDNGYAVRAVDYSVFNATARPSYPPEYQGGKKITGDIEVQTAGSVDIGFISGSSFFVGRTMLDWENDQQYGIGPSSIYLTFDKGSIWRVTGDSNLTLLGIAEGSLVDLSNSNSPLASPTNLMIGNLQGSDGNFKQRLNISGENENAYNEGDTIAVLESSEGNFKLNFIDASTGSYSVNENSKLLVVEQMSNPDLSNYKATFSGSADLGAYVFNATKGEGEDNNWYLTTDGTKAKDPDTKGVNPPLTNAASASIGFLHINYLSNFIDTQTLLQRMGELRDKRDMNNTDDAWVRLYGGKLSSFDSLTKLDDVSYYGLQAGADRAYDNDYGRGYLGFMFGYSNSDISYEKGDGESKNYYGGLYGTFMFNQGTYVDLIAKYGKNDNKFNTVTSNGFSVDGRGTTNGYSLSLEAGHRVDIENFFVEPQAQFTYSSQGDMEIRSSNGLKTNMDDYNSILARVGLIFGFEINNNANMYYKFGYIKELGDDVSYSFNNQDKNSLELNSDIFDTSIGLTYSAGEHNFYIEGIYQIGDKFDNMKGNIGYRYEF